MAKNIQRKSSGSYVIRRSSTSGKLPSGEIRSIAGSTLTQKVTKALRSANTATQTFKPKNAK
jgi:hypothetical protein